MSAGLNPADCSSSISLTNTNHTATCTAAGNHSVRGINSHTTGKWYMEFTSINFQSASGVVGLGVAADGLDTNSVLEFGAQNGGTVANSFGATASLGSAPDGHVVSIAVDLTNNLAWVRLDGGSWVGSGAGADPSTGAKGLSISGRSAALFPWIRLQNNAPPTATFNGGDSSFAESVPSGFTGWDVSGASLPSVSRPVVIF